MAKFSKLTQGKMTINGTVGDTNFELSGIDNAFLSSSADTRLITSDAVYTELQRIGYIPYGNPAELMISGFLENQQYCDNPPDLRGLIFYVKYENSYHKYVPVTDSHITADNWGSSEGFLTTTVTYTENGIAVSGTISAYCVSENVLFRADDYNPNGISKSDFSKALLNCFERDDVDYQGGYNILGYNFSFMRKCVRMPPTTLSVGSTSTTHKGSGIWEIEAITGQTYTFSLSRLFGYITVTATNGRAKGYKYSGYSRGSYSTVKYRSAAGQTSGPEGYMSNVNGRTMNSMIYNQNWSYGDDWEINNFVFDAYGLNLYIEFGNVSGSEDGRSTAIPGVDICYNGGMTLNLSYPYGTVDSVGLWGIDFTVDSAPTNIADVVSIYDDIILNPVADVTVRNSTSRMHISPEYSSWYAINYDGDYTDITPLYSFRSSHVTGDVKNIRSGTYFSYSDRNGNVVNISSNIQEIFWDNNTITVRYKDSSLIDREITLGGSNGWYPNYQIYVKANPTRTDGSTKY